jgi:hypothetical protein
MSIELGSELYEIPKCLLQIINQDLVAIPNS